MRTLTPMGKRGKRGALAARHVAARQFAHFTQGKHMTQDTNPTQDTLIARAALRKAVAQYIRLVARDVNGTGYRSSGQLALTGEVMLDLKDQVNSACGADQRV